MDNTTEEILWVNLTGSMANFRKPVSMTTKKTYDIPPRTTVSGMLAAGLGYGSNEYYEEFDPEVTEIGIQVCSDISIKSFAENYKTTTGSEFKTVKLPNGDKVSMQKPSNFPEMDYQQEVTEYIRDPNYVIYVKTENKELHNNLKEMFRNRQWIYQPYFGSSECVAGQRGWGVIDSYDVISGTDITVDSVVPEPSIDSVFTKEQLHVDQFVENFEKSGDSREITNFIDYYYTKDGSTELSVQSDEVYRFSRDGSKENIIIH